MGNWCSRSLVPAIIDKNLTLGGTFTNTPPADTITTEMGSADEIAIQAAKFKDRRLTDYVYELLPEANPDVEIIFFHGLQMEGSPPEYSHWRTWKMRKSEDCWPETLLPQMLSWRDERDGRHFEIKARVLSVSYEARPDPGKYGHGTGSSDDYRISECLVDNIIFDHEVHLGQRDRVPVFLVGHDLGGILIKRLVMMLEVEGATNPDQKKRIKILKFLGNLKCVFFFATPHCGSEAIETMASKINKHDANQMLRFMKVLNELTSRTNQEFQKFRHRTDKKSGFTSHAVHATHETNEGGFHNVLVVPEGSARYDVDSLYSASANHFSVCQPKDESSSSIQHLCNQIKEEVRKAKGGMV
ncbi:hypothetical protein R1sor_015389 [Riccia sorocarpa]|uniref:DUF676 domain-containing protein n=1 Tax=Riccia sorocarpa TaxID=122646 RepID=A0ABD3HFE7_9MARC